MSTTSYNREEALNNDELKGIVENLEKINHDGGKLEINKVSTKPGKIWARGTVTIKSSKPKGKDTVKRCYFDICD